MGSALLRDQLSSRTSSVSRRTAHVNVALTVWARTNDTRRLLDEIQSPDSRQAGDSWLLNRAILETVIETDFLSHESRE